MNSVMRVNYLEEKYLDNPCEPDDVMSLILSCKYVHLDHSSASPPLLMVEYLISVLNKLSKSTNHQPTNHKTRKQSFQVNVEENKSSH